MARLRNPWKFALQSRAIGDAEHGGAYIQPGQTITVSEEAAAEASKTGVLQWLDGPDGLDGKFGPNGERPKTPVPA